MTKPFSGEQRLIESFNFLEQNGGDLKELLPESRNLSTTELYNLDIVFVVVITLFILLLTMIIAYQMCWKLLKDYYKKEIKKKNDKKIK